MTVGQSSRRGRGCGGLSSPSVVFSDSKDTELRTLEMTLPLCHVKSVRRHLGTAVRFASLLERCRASFEHSLLDVGRCNSFPRFLNTSVSKKESKKAGSFILQYSLLFPL